MNGVGTIVVVVTASFLLVHLVPGDPARIQLGPFAPESSVQALRHTEGLDASLPSQYATFVKHVFTGNLGYSFTQHADVAPLISSRLAPTVLVVVLGLLLAIAIALPAGLYSGLHPDGYGDRVIRNLGQALYLTPIFWLGLVLAYIFGVNLHLLPTSGYGSGFGAQLRSLVLPTLTLGLIASSLFMRILRSSVITTADSPFIEAVTARGVPRHRVVLHHVSRNSAIPLITTVGLTLGFLVSSSIVVESVFNLPGLGALLVQAVTQRDFQTIQGLTIVFGTAVVLINLATDVLYVLVDPRVRL